jgi:hypothetical protein
LAVFGIFGTVPATAHGQRPIVNLPTVAASAWNDASESPTTLDEDDLGGFERDLRQQFARRDSPDEVLAMATLSASDLILTPWVPPDDAVEVFLHGERGELRWFTNATRERYFWRQLGPEEVRSIHGFSVSSKLAGLRSLGQTRVENGEKTLVVHGVAYVLLEMNPSRGGRTIIFNPPRKEGSSRLAADSPLWQYTKVVDFFDMLANGKGLAVRYCLPRSVPGLEVVYAHPKTEIRAVWKREGRLCVTVGKFDLLGDEHKALRSGELAEPVAALELAEKSVDAVGNLRADPACESSDGRWAIGVVNGGRLVCFDRSRKTFVELDKEIQSGFVPLHYLEARNAFLLARFSVHPLKEYMPIWPTAFRLFDPKAGKSSDVPEHSLSVYDEAYAPWFQQLPRRLQKADGRKANVVWLSMRTDYGTRVGRYDVESFRWLSRQAIPALRVQIADIWVDEESHRVYFVYKGHLLAVPLSQHDTEQEKR